MKTIFKKIKKEKTKVVKIKKVKKKTRGQLVKILDAVFSLYIRLRDCDKGGITRCPLCLRYGSYKEAQNMHFITRGCYALRWDDNNCHSGCIRCNIFLNGNYIEYTRRMIDKYGLDYVDELRNIKNQIYIISTPDIEVKIRFYKEKVIELLQKKAINKKV